MRATSRRASPMWRPRRDRSPWERLGTASTGCGDPAVTCARDVVGVRTSYTPGRPRGGDFAPRCGPARAGARVAPPTVVSHSSKETANSPLTFSCRPDGAGCPRHTVDRGRRAGRHAGHDPTPRHGGASGQAGRPAARNLAVTPGRRHGGTARHGPGPSDRLPVRLRARGELLYFAGDRSPRAPPARRPPQLSTSRRWPEPSAATGCRWPTWPRRRGATSP